MVSIVELVPDEEYEASTAAVAEGVQENIMRWTCRPRFTRLQGGAGSSPLLQCLIRVRASFGPGPPASFLAFENHPQERNATPLTGRSPAPPARLSQNSEASMLVARFIIKVFPGLVMDTYRWRPQGDSRSLRSPFEGENVLHLVIVKRIPDFILFIERYVPRGHLKLRYLGGGQTTGRFFAPGSAAYYGQTPISFAAATGASFWFFLYLARRLEVNLNVKDSMCGDRFAQRGRSNADSEC